MTSSRFASFARGLLALAAALPFAALAGCESDVNGGGGDETCELDGQTYQAGESFPSPDGCNTCSCMDDGSIACTLMACANGCPYEGGYLSPGDQVQSPDGCNMCTCMDDGTLACTDMGCVTCDYQGQTFTPGDTFPAGDGCNMCSCMDDGSIACTAMACPICVYEGAEHQPGESFPSIDGCNTCTCMDDGTVSCTEIACPCDPPNEWWREYASLDAQECLLLDFACPANTLRFDNACGCGCEQDASCPQFFDCMPPAQCDVQALMEQCPYSEIAF